MDHRNSFDESNIGARTLVTTSLNSEERIIALSDRRRPVLCYSLALCYLYGFGTEKDLQKTANLLEEAILLGCEKSRWIRDSFQPSEIPRPDCAVAKRLGNEVFINEKQRVSKVISMPKLNLNLTYSIASYADKLTIRNNLYLAPGRRRLLIKNSTLHPVQAKSRPLNLKCIT